MRIPDAYRCGYEKARQVDPGMAELYVQHTMLGDAAADAAVDACASVSVQQQFDWIKRGLEGGSRAIPDAPKALQDLIAESEKVPDWFDLEKTRAGSRLFHGHSETFLQAFVGAVLIEGFCTMIAKSFAITGRLVDQGVRRIKQNNRHVAEIFLPGGLDVCADGWRASVRIRLVHARIRALLKTSSEWDIEAWGMPISSAHVGFGNAAFSGLLLKRAEMLGIDFVSGEERESFMLVWRYSGHLMGVHPDLLCATQDEAFRLHRVGVLCEPPPDIESILVANGLISSAPVIVGITDPSKRRALTKRIYRVSRAMIGDQLADQLNFPVSRSHGLLAAIRMKYKAGRLLRRIFPAMESRHRIRQFKNLTDLSFYDSGAAMYSLPQHLHAERDRPAADSGKD